MVSVLETLTGGSDVQTSPQFLLTLGFGKGLAVIDTKNNVLLDTVTAVSVPEPAVLGLLGLGVAGLAPARRKKTA